MYLEARQIATILFSRIKFARSLRTQWHHFLFCKVISASSSFISAHLFFYRTSFSKIEHPLVLPNIFYLCRTSLSFIGHLLFTTNMLACWFIAHSIRVCNTTWIYVNSIFCPQKAFIPTLNWTLSHLGSTKLTSSAHFLSYRCLRIGSSPWLLQCALDDLKRHLSRNGYPPWYYFL